VGVVRTQVRLQKLDFWLRNPDYLADELLTKYEATTEARLLELAGRILDSEEDDVAADHAALLLSAWSAPTMCAARGDCESTIAAVGVRRQAYTAKQITI
jgi:hypothetical protein